MATCPRWHSRPAATARAAAAPQAGPRVAHAQAAGAGAAGWVGEDEGPAGQASPPGTDEAETQSMAGRETAGRAVKRTGIMAGRRRLLGCHAWREVCCALRVKMTQLHQRRPSTGRSRRARPDGSAAGGAATTRSSSAPTQLQLLQPNSYTPRLSRTQHLAPAGAPLWLCRVPLQMPPARVVPHVPCPNSCSQPSLLCTSEIGFWLLFYFHFSMDPGALRPCRVGCATAAAAFCAPVPTQT